MNHSLVEFVYIIFCIIWCLLVFFMMKEYFKPTTEYVKQVNNFILSLIYDEENIYLTSNTSCQSYENQEIRVKSLH